MELESGVYPVNQWYDYWEGKSQTNFGATVGMIGARETTFNPEYKTERGDFLNDMQWADDTGTTMDWSTMVPTEAQTKEILGRIDEGLKQGALGVGNCAGYMVGGFTSKEAWGIQELAGKYGRFVSMHGRFSSQMPPTTGVLGTNRAARGGGHGGRRTDRRSHDGTDPGSDA